MTSNQPVGVATELHPLRPITSRFTRKQKRIEINLGTRVSNAQFEIELEDVHDNATSEDFLGRQCNLDILAALQCLGAKT